MKACRIYIMQPARHACNAHSIKFKAQVAMKHQTHSQSAGRNFNIFYKKIFISKSSTATKSLDLHYAISEGRILKASFSGPPWCTWALGGRYGANAWWGPQQACWVRCTSHEYAINTGCFLLRTEKVLHVKFYTEVKGWGSNKCAGWRYLVLGRGGFAVDGGESPC